MLDGIVKARGEGTGAGQYFGVEAVESADFDAEDSASASQAATEGGHLEEVGQDNPDWDKGGGGMQLADTGDGVGGFAASSGGEKK